MGTQVHPVKHQCQSGMIHAKCGRTTRRGALHASATQQRLAAMVTRLRQLTELKVMQTNQRRLVTEPDVLSSFTAILAAIALSRTRS